MLHKACYYKPNGNRTEVAGVIPASRGGKLKTITQIVAISFYLLPLPESFSIVGQVIMYLAVILTLATAVDYIMKAIMTDREEQ